MKSNWESAKERSTYHFDSHRVDSKEDCLTHLGHIKPDAAWTSAVESIVQQAKPATWATRGYKGEGVPPPREDLAAEEYDLTSNGMSADLPITHISWAIPEQFQPLVDSFGLEDCMARLHVQKPGELWNLHIDKLQKWAPENPESVLRVFIQLTDWQPGQFWEFGNYHWNQWSAGDVVTFDWANMPHCTANAGYEPRVTLQLTGVKTARTYDFLANLDR
jgi:hypothetical protein